ncbi:XdhC family protein [Chelatococcus asaccharovorans]|uniref:Putative sulfurylase large subunit (Molybdopterin cytosine dinucleotide biosynthesis) n=1 Tax=Chelatococcus asaccharovorans TaxID=28210 RepID=A0A2V3TWM0_9HYPH|nr:XdhC family protein [Chelatococcus asaccharovorans]MBS7704146.1 XdhC family protein [Chelatococcus asaccharovorans]PXW53228.1 putative sulfurylase large subunit (molybdopterin cytosine dinucleotide biosynthesis) [Chelatococcus asaccharovorans]
MELESLATLNAERAARRAAVLVTPLDGGPQRLVKAADVAGDPLGAGIAERLRLGKSGLLETDAGRYFLTVQVPPVRLVVTGAVHISQALAPMARLIDLDVTIIDPRTAFASPERFPDVRLLAAWPDAVLRDMPIDRYTAFAALTHDPKIDDPALAAALRSEAFYVGALGSRKTHAKRLERLGEQGFSDMDLARIKAPIGLPIGAVSPAEIALAILGEVVAALRLTSPRGEAS